MQVAGDGGERKRSSLLDPLKVDVATIKVILLTAGVVIVLLSAPLGYILRNFVTFDALDSYFKLTDSVRPRILRSIAEQLESGYSKNFLLTQNSTDNTMLFYAAPDQQVFLTISSDPIGSAPPVTIAVNNCPVVKERTGPFHLYKWELSAQLRECPPDEPNLHTLRISLPSQELKGSALNISSLVLVSQRIHDHLKDADQKK